MSIFGLQHRATVTAGLGETAQHWPVGGGVQTDVPLVLRSSAEGQAERVYTIAQSDLEDVPSASGKLVVGDLTLTITRVDYSPLDDWYTITAREIG